VTGHSCAPRARLATAFVAVFLTSVAVAQDTPFAADGALEGRVRELEETVHRLEQGRKTPDPPAVPQSTVCAGWDNGFVLRSPDDQFRLRITGQIQTDYRYYLDSADTTDIPTFLIRRARLGIEASVFRYFEFRLLPDFGQGNTRLQDAYLNVHYWNEFQFETGKFKQPFSLEQLIQDRFVPTVERSLIDQLVPARDVGVMVHGQGLFGDRLDYGLSVYDGLQNGDQDTDPNKETAGRIVARPFRGFGLPDFVEPLQIGVAGTYGEDDGALQPTVVRTPANVPWFTFAPGVRPDGRRARCSPELAYVYGPVMVLAQYYRDWRVLRAPARGGFRAADVELNARGFYVLVTCLLTGEERTSVSQAIIPLSPFEPHAGHYGLGAWELLGRVSRLEFDSDDPAAIRLVDPARSAGRATEFLAGVNWYLNPFVRFQFSWEYARFSNRVRLGPGPAGLLDHQNSFIIRTQIIF
jgi:phosphate-selective porin OprO and OprP